MRGWYFRFDYLQPIVLLYKCINVSVWSHSTPTCSSPCRQSRLPGRCYRCLPLPQPDGEAGAGDGEAGAGDGEAEHRGPLPSETENTGCTGNKKKNTGKKDNNSWLPND